MRTIIVLALLASSAWGRQSLQGECSQGNNAVQFPTLGFTSSTLVERSFPGCTVAVYITGTGTPGTLAAIYSDNVGTVLANPFVATAAGHWQFWADDGRYNVAFSGGGIATPFTLYDNSLLDPAILTGIHLIGSGIPYPSIAAAYAAGLSTGAWITVSPGNYTQTAQVVLTPGKPLHLTCGGQGGDGSGATQQTGITTIGWNSPGYFVVQNPTEVTHYVTIDNCSFNIGASATGWMLAGSTSQNVSASLYRYGWAFSNVVVTGPGESVEGMIGMSLTQLVGLTFSNFTIQSFEQTAIFDRLSVITANHIRFFKYRYGPLFTQKGGSGTVAAYAAQTILTNAEFLGPSIGTGQYCVTIDDIGVEFIMPIYEIEFPGATAAIHITNLGRNFRDFGGFFSFFGATIPTYTMVWDNNFSEMSFFGTEWSGGTLAPPICMGVPGTCTGGHDTGYGSAVTCMGCSASLYSIFQALGPVNAVAFGSSPRTYGPYAAVTGPLQVDVLEPNHSAGFGDVLRGNITRNGLLGDIQRVNLAMPSSDQAALAPVGVESVTESLSAGHVQAGVGIRTGNEVATFYAIYVDGATGDALLHGNLTINATVGRVGGCAGVHVYALPGPPNSLQNGCIGDMATNVSGTAGNIFWVKETGNNTNTGWVAH